MLTCPKSCTGFTQKRGKLPQGKKDRFKLKGEFVCENENENCVYAPCSAGGLCIGLHGTKKGNCCG
jgi:hypothetical protein